MEHLDKASQQPRIYPYDMHQTYQAARNPALPLQPPITPDGTGS
jgi:hypothetical protein